MRPREGRGLLELLLVFWLFGLVLAAVGRVAVGQRRLAEAQDQRVRVAEAVRTVALVLGAEVRMLTRRDIAASSDSLRLRAMRGSGRVCGFTGDAVLVRYSGVRQPDPRKDSLLLLDGIRPGRAYGITAVLEEPACGGALRLRVDAPPEPVPAFALVFESGAYHLANAALRYRMGREGRQPLTEAFFQDPRFEWQDGVPRALLPLDPDSLPLHANPEQVVPLWSLNGS